MDSDDKIERFRIMAKGLRGRQVENLLVDATREQGLFVFGELFDIPSVKELTGTESGWSLDLLELFAYGTWSQYRGSMGKFRELDEKQALKLKQLTAVTLAQEEKRISYQTLMESLDIPTVRQLEDFLINHCIYAGLIKGRLNQKEKLLRVQECVPRDVRREDLPSVLAGVQAWIVRIRLVNGVIEDRITWAQKESELAETTQAEVEAKVADVKSQLHKIGDEFNMEILEPDFQSEGLGLDPPAVFHPHVSRQSSAADELRSLPFQPDS
eukprot:jgi/Botrbrau1/13110/Bobra.0187s0067.1